jgi:hypothetical protein
MEQSWNASRIGKTSGDLTTITPEEDDKGSKRTAKEQQVLGAHNI